MCILIIFTLCRKRCILILARSRNNNTTIRQAESLSDLSSPEHKYHNRHKPQYASHNREENKRELIPNPPRQSYRVKRKRHAESLADQVEQLRHFAALRSVAVDGICIARCRDDLQAKARNAHSHEWHDPRGVVLQREAVDEQACWDERLASPDCTETNFRRGIWRTGTEAMARTSYDCVDDDAGGELGVVLA